MATWTALTHTKGREAAEALAEAGEDLTVFLFAKIDFESQEFISVRNTFGNLDLTYAKLNLDEIVYGDEVILGVLDIAFSRS